MPNKCMGVRSRAGIGMVLAPIGLALAALRGWWLQFVEGDTGGGDSARGAGADCDYRGELGAGHRHTRGRAGEPAHSARRRQLPTSARGDMTDYPRHSPLRVQHERPVRWDPAQYGRFGNERDRPFLDLTVRIEASAPRHVVDIGCGPGTLTGLLAKRWPNAIVEGIDSSPEMIAVAADVPGVSFPIADAADWQPAGDVDVVASNAALQWIPRHQKLMHELASALPSGGWLAVQVPGTSTSRRTR